MLVPGAIGCGGVRREPSAFTLPGNHLGESELFFEMIRIERFSFSPGLMLFPAGKDPPQQTHGEKDSVVGKGENQEGVHLAYSHSQKAQWLHQDS